MNKIAILDVNKRTMLFKQVSDAMNIKSSIVEKDFWVTWVLGKIFQDETLSKIFMFKGGTSLSKVFNLIDRFSEDIDLILDWNLVSSQNPLDEQGSKNKQVKFNEAINENAKEYIQSTLLPILSNTLAPLCECDMGDDGFCVNIKYPNVFTDSYLRPEIILEIGPLASWMPSNTYEISSFAAQNFPHLFENPKVSVNAIVAIRTFWEKATILHKEANRAENSVLPLRYFRHYYDTAMMALRLQQDEFKDISLLKSVVEFKQKFYPSAWAKYEDIFTDKLKLLPPKFRFLELEKDYEAMQNMIFGEKMTFSKIIDILQNLELNLNINIQNYERNLSQTKRRKIKI